MSKIARAIRLGILSRQFWLWKNLTQVKAHLFQRMCSVYKVLPTYREHTQEKKVMMPLRNDENLIFFSATDLSVHLTFYQLRK